MLNVSVFLVYHMENDHDCYDQKPFQVFIVKKGLPVT